jgi:PKD repeat protein
VTVTDTTGCAASACQVLVDSQIVYSPCQIFFVVYPDPTALGWYYGVLYTQNTPLTYLWNFGDGTTSTQLFPSHTYAVPGRYTLCLTVSDGAGCSYTFCDSAFYAYKNGGGPMRHFNVASRQMLGVKDISTPSKISLYPNPANGILTIDAGDQQVEGVTIYTVNGQVISDVKAPVQNKVNTGNLADGIYFMEVRTNERTTKIKFIKAN